MSVFDLLRSQNSIEYAPSPLRSVSEGAAGGADRGPELAPALAAAPPGGTMPGAGPALPATAPATTSPANADPPGIQAQYYIENAGKERRYYKDLEGKQLAFRADNKAVTTKQEDQATISHMLDVAQSRGWTSLHVRGTATFKQEAWIEAQARGLSVKGYKPTADDKRSLATRRAARTQKAEAEPSATMQQPPPENTIANVAQPQQQPAHAVQPTQATAPVWAPVPAAPAAAQQVANGRMESQAEEKSQHLDRKATGEAKPAEPGADAGEPVERTGKAKREAPAAKAGPEPTNQQYSSRAREPWMEETGGHAALAPAQQASAERSHGRWVAAGTTQKPHTMDLEEYVDHVQSKQAEARAKEDKLELKAHNGKGRGEAEARPAPSAPTAKATAENGTAEAMQLSPNARKVLAYLEERIETQMGKLTDDMKADLRTHAAQVIAKRENEVGPVKLPTVKADRKQQAGRDQVAEAPKRKASGGEQKPAQIQQPRMGMG